MKELGIYIHIPFCIQKCFYCDFHSYSNMQHRIMAYINALIKEMDSWKEKLANYQIKSVFIGGGTPSIVPIDAIDKIINTLHTSFRLSSDLEFTIESNPGTLEKQKIKYYLENDINRLSIGLQAWQNPLLKELGRIHTQEMFVKNYLLAREMGFKNINVDIMFGLPHQTSAQWEETLRNVVVLQPEHISAYSLKIEDNTIFGKKYDKGMLQLPSEEEDRWMYHFAIDFLQNYQYQHYEISNFSKEDKACMHNKIYWYNEEYIGFGLGAHSYIDQMRFSNEILLDKYVEAIEKKQLPCTSKEKISLHDEVAETMFLGLRMMEGIDIEKFTRRFGFSPFKIYASQISKLQDRGLLIVEGEKMKLTRKGIDLSNTVFVEFLLD
ncbi:radical SAM family heme chaperone HemW [Clostridiaceae bacterium 35-E11]